MARERDIPIEDVHREDAEELTRPMASEIWPQVPPRWEARLTPLGHGLEDITAPAVARWHILHI